ncbi:hypothetical protein [Neptuniibacter sp.]|uniref:hypothetical protein n=1 Tax=Neptuniibacter sp. TaxID=1962643 RepID=UPI002602C247|nr:hypothetical protein [Neptuniibacter sp.]MCP4597041.1 hypothetical protein [Neptuniibacter sp.]
MPNGNGVTWQQMVVILSIIALMITCGGIVAGKASKTDVIRVEERCNSRLMLSENNVKTHIDRLERKQDKMYDLLLKIEQNGNSPKSQEKPKP